MALKPSYDTRVFLNVPFDRRYESLFAALIAGLVYLGKRPTCVLEVPAEGAIRKDRILDQIRSCAMSIHDLSRVQYKTIHGARLPRFNMPFELGLAIAVSKLDRRRPEHGVVLLEERNHRLPVTLSDVNGLDAHVHEGTQIGIAACLLDTFGGGGPDELERMTSLARSVSRFLADRKRAYNLESIYRRDLFEQAISTATDKAELQQAQGG